MGRSKSRRAGLIAITIVVAIAIHDLSMPRGHGLAARGAVFMIDEYRAHISPRLGPTCRFKPTCSAYGREAIRKYGFAKGSAKTAWRIARCGPWTKVGTRDLP